MEKDKSSNLERSESMVEYVLATISIIATIMLIAVGLYRKIIIGRLVKLEIPEIQETSTLKILKVEFCEGKRNGNQCEAGDEWRVTCEKGLSYLLPVETTDIIYVDDKESVCFKRMFLIPRYERIRWFRKRKIENSLHYELKSILYLMPDMLPEDMED